MSSLHTNAATPKQPRYFPVIYTELPALGDACYQVDKARIVGHHLCTVTHKATLLILSIALILFSHFINSDSVMAVTKKSVWN